MSDDSPMTVDFRQDVTDTDPDFLYKELLSVYPIACLLFELGNRVGRLPFSLLTQLTESAVTADTDELKLRQHQIFTCLCLFAYTTMSLCVYYYNYHF